MIFSWVPLKNNIKISWLLQIGLLLYFLGTTLNKAATCSSIEKTWNNAWKCTLMGIVAKCVTFTGILNQTGQMFQGHIQYGVSFHPHYHSALFSSLKKS